MALVCSLSGVQVRSTWEDAGVTVMVHGCSALCEMEAPRTLHSATTATTLRFNQLRSLIDESNIAVGIWYIIHVRNRERQKENCNCTAVAFTYVLVDTITHFFYDVERVT
jgi:hypothetical protein